MPVRRVPVSAIRLFLSRPRFPERLAAILVREPGLEARLAGEDHAFAYDFIVEASSADASVVLGDYQVSDSPEALALERECAQGRGLRLSFRRETFHRRAEGFAVHRLFTARAGGRLVESSRWR